MTASSLDELVRREGGRVLATLIRMTGDFDLAEDAVQDAVVAALETWPAAGVPDSPGAWLTTTARRKALDRIRRENGRRHKEGAAVALLGDEGATSAATDLGTSAVRDDLLRLIFTCCHPALSFEAQVALTLRTVCRMTTGDIAAVFLVPETTMGQRISRAKKKIAVARIPYRVPEDHELQDRLRAVLAVVHAVFTTGHHAATGDAVVRVDVASEAIRLGRVLVELVPDDAECAGLLALMLATDARRSTRVDERGDVVLLADQDRSQWDANAVAEAGALVDAALRRRRPGPYQIKAAIACLHTMAPAWLDTDWPQIAELYRLLEHHEPTGVVRVNRAVAEAEVSGPAAGLVLLDGLTGVDGWYLYWSTKADFLRRLARYDDAASAYRHALACTGGNEADRRFLQRRLDEVSSRT